MTFVTGQFFLYIFLARAKTKMAIQKACSPGISDDLINFWDESIKNKMAAAAI